MQPLIRNTAAALAVGAGLAFASCGTGDDREDAGGSRPTRYVLPGDNVFPEGIALQKSTGDFFVGSTTDGTIYRGNIRGERLEEFLPGGADGRTAVTGMKVDGRGRLWVAGRFTERTFVYDVRTKRLIRTLRAPRVEPSFTPRDERSLVNDMTVTDGAMYITDSFAPVIYRVSTTGDEIGEMEPWLRLQGTAARYKKGFNLNGISASDGGRYLLSAATDSGKLFRIDTQTKAVRQVDLGAATLRTADGLLLDGRTLLVVKEEPGEVVPVRLSADLLRGEVRAGFGRSELAFPTTLAELDGRVLVVNSQFDRAKAPRLPFTITGLSLPPRAKLR